MPFYFFTEADNMTFLKWVIRCEDKSFTEFIIDYPLKVQFYCFSRFGYIQ